MIFVMGMRSFHNPDGDELIVMEVEAKEYRFLAIMESQKAPPPSHGIKFGTWSFSPGILSFMLLLLLLLLLYLRMCANPARAREQKC